MQITGGLMKASKQSGGVVIHDNTRKRRSVIFKRDIYLGVEYVTVSITDENGTTYPVRMTHQQCLDLEGLL